MSEDNWADLGTYRCGTCRFFVPKDGEPGTLKTGRCRRHAPTMDGYPVVYISDWCGDHKLGTNPSRQVSTTDVQAAIGVAPRATGFPVVS